MPGPTRRARAAGGRPHHITVWFSGEEFAAVATAAQRAGMAPGAWLGQFSVQQANASQEPGLPESPSGGREAALELMALRAELMQTRRVLTNVGGNLNDVARHANSTGELHAATARVQALVARVVARVEATVDHVDRGMGQVLGRGRARGTAASAGHSGHSGHRGHGRAGHAGRGGGQACEGGTGATGSAPEDPGRGRG